MKLIMPGVPQDALHQPAAEIAAMGAAELPLRLDVSKVAEVEALGAVQTRLEDVVQSRNPTDPLAHKPELGTRQRAALRTTG